MDIDTCNLAIYAYQQGAPAYMNRKELMKWIYDKEVDDYKVTDYMGAFEDCIPRCREMAARIDTQGIGEAVKRYFIRKERL